MEVDAELWNRLTELSSQWEHKITHHNNNEIANPVYWNKIPAQNNADRPYKAIRRV
jgi:hypothetical protein